jgi:hypothetical protein
MVYVINKDGSLLMPCRNVIARLLLKDRKARVKKTYPFTIKLLNQAENSYTQELTLGIDTGSSKVGSAVVDQSGNVLYISEIEIRNDITEKMTRRAKYRRNRRARKTRYRECRFKNRLNSTKKDRISPAIRSKIDSHLKEIKFVKSILPISKVILETGKFDPHALKNPEVLKNKKLYQKGLNYGYANTKAYVLDRDNHTCQNCKNKSKDKKLEVHHIIYRKNGGSDEQENLITLCKSCHDGVHSKNIILKNKGKVKGYLKHATQMNSIRIQLLKLLSEVEETFGYITKENRQNLGLLKEHYIDAIVIASNGGVVNYNHKDIIYKKSISDGDYQQTKGVRSEMRLPTKKVQGYRKFDKVKYLGKEYFIKGKMSTGYAILMDIRGEAVKLKPMAKFSNMSREKARTSCIY